MANFFRAQRKGYDFNQMKRHDSIDGGDGHSKGLACSTSPDGLDGGSRFGGAYDAMNDDDEVVILKGNVISQIYDGVRIRPTEEVARFTVAEWTKKIKDGSAWDYETPWGSKE